MAIQGLKVLQRDLRKLQFSENDVASDFCWSLRGNKITDSPMRGVRL